MKKVNSILLFSVYQLLILQLFALDKEVHSFAIEDGLPNNAIYSITEDASGLIWLNTGNGLVRFDGYRFIPIDFPSNPEVPIVGQDEQLWGTANANIYVLYSQNRTWKFKTTPPITGQITSLQIYQDTLLFYTVENNLCQYNTQTGKTIYRQFANDISHIIVTNNYLYAATPTQLHQLHCKSLEHIGSLHMRNIQMLYTADDGKLLAGTPEKLYRIANIPDPYPKELLKGYSVIDITETANQYWIITKEQGLIQLSKNTNQVRVLNSTIYSVLANKQLTCIYTDRNENVWVGSRYNGLYLISKPRQRFLHFHSGKPIGLTKNQITGLQATNNGDILIMHPSQLWQWTPNSPLAHPIEVPKESGIQYNVFHKTDDKVYVGTNEGIFDFRTNQLHHLSQTSNLDVAAFKRRANGIWLIVTHDNAFIQADKNFNVLSRIVPGKMRSDGIPPNRILDMIETRDGKIYLGTETGLVIFNESLLNFSFINDKSEEQSSPKNVNCLFEDHNGILWLGTQGEGLFSYDPEKKIFIQYGNLQGLTASSIFSILQDEHNQLWMGTNQGLLRYNIEKNRFTRFSSTDGVQDNIFLPASACLLKTGEMLFGGINGFNLFDPNLFVTASSPSALIISEVLVNTRLLTDDYSNLVLQHDQNDVSLEFALLNYANPQKNTYAIKVDGLTEQWSNLGARNSVSYNNLNPGQYMVHIKGWNNDGVESTPIQLAITILPPWWKKTSAYIVYALIAMFFSGLIIRFFWQRIRLRNRLQLEMLKRQQSEEMIDFKLQFFTNVSHEIRTPLTLISGPLQRLAEQENPQTEKAHLIQVIRQNTERLLRLVEQLLDFRKLQSDKLPFRPVNLDLVLFIEDLLKAFKGFADTQHVTIKKTLPNVPLIIGFDPDKMEKILFNLLSNAIKFSPPNGTVEVAVRVKDTHLELSVIDEGPGIKGDKREKIFNQFESENGVGIGLALTRELVKMHGGTIICQQNNRAQGCTFKVTLPSGTYQSKERNTSAKINTDEAIVGEKPVLIVAEDNQDLRAYIASIFTERFNVLQAEDGMQALELCQQYLPHLIISDVMMPNMDGMTLCRHIKTSIDTSHIPLVLLTAYTDIQNQLAGANAGADLYIPKPFNEELLKTNVLTLLANRQRIKEKYSKSLSIEVTSLASSDMDNNLVTKLTNFIEKNLDDSTLSVEQLAKQVGLSRSQLTRKLNTLAGMSPGLFLQNYRLKKAAASLKETTLSISEIAYKTGFSDPKYFSRNFKKTFGVSPSDYRL